MQQAIALPSTEDAQQLILRHGRSQLGRAVQYLCRTDFRVFQKVELEMELGPHHYEWWNRLQTRRDICEMAPRDHGKSMSLAQAYPLYRAKYDHWCRDIFLLGADQPSAVENLDKIKDLLETKPTMRQLLPKAGKDRIYSRTEVKLSNGTTLKARSFGSRLRGRHPQLIIGDDILNEQNSLTPENRRETRKYFMEVVLPMKDKGLPAQRAKGFFSQIVLIGTAQDREDLYHELQKNPGFIGKKMKAVMDESKGGREVVLWPDRYTYLDLMQIKATQGALSFSKEYQNEPMSEDTTIFPPSLFEPLLDRDLSYARSYSGPYPVYLGADFSVPGSTDGDWTVFYVMMYNTDTKEFIPLNYWRERPATMQAQIHQLELMCQMYGVSIGMLEDNLFQRVYAEHFRQKTSLPLVGHTVTHGAKANLEYGVLGFRPLFENRVFRFPYKTAQDQALTDHMMLEFNGIVQRRGKIGNESYHDDTVMAMWHALTASKQTTFSVSWS